MFYTVASEICWEGGKAVESRFNKGDRERRLEEMKEEGGYERLETLELVKRYYPDAKVDEGWWRENTRRGCFDCTKAERLLGWVHEDG